MCFPWNLPTQWVARADWSLPARLIRNRRGGLIAFFFCRFDLLMIRVFSPAWCRVNHLLLLS